MRRSGIVVVAVLGVVLAPRGGEADGFTGLSYEGQLQAVCDVAFCDSGCDAGGVIGHVAPDGSERGGFPHTDCFPGGNCATIHPKCGEGEVTYAPRAAVTPREFLGELLEGAVAGKLDAMQTLLAAFPDVVFLNEESRSLQISACDGETLLAHLPLSQDQYAALRATD